jgi:sulfonate transport system substrate-binding protein
VEFAFGPPILEAINTSNVDFGFTGDAPPIFAQAAAANFYYVAAVPKNYGEAIIVPEDSPIKSLADLKGKKIAAGKASSAHHTLLVGLEKAGLAPSDVTFVFLPPADAAAAFSRGSVDAWSIWDPFLALAQLQKPVRAVAFSSDLHNPSSFYLANKDFTSKYPQIISKLNGLLAKEADWANEHRAEVSQALHEASGVDLVAVRNSVDRAFFKVLPVTDEIAATQQTVADHFLKVGLIPKPLVVRDVVWKWTPGS